MAQFKIKKDKYDHTFSEFIKLRDQRCQRWGKQTGQLETSHFFSRANQALRCDPDNACLKCNACHRWWHKNPVDAAEWLKSIIGEAAYELLRYKARQPQKFSTFSKDERRKEQQQQIKDMKAKTLVIPCFNARYRPLQARKITD